MTFAVVFVLSLLIVLIRNRGRLEFNRAIHLRGLAFIFVALLMQIVEVYGSDSFNPAERLAIRAALLMVSLLCLLLVIVLNWAYRAIRLLGLGLGLNGLVMMLNGGFMPITPEMLVLIGQRSLVSTLEPGNFVDRSKDILLYASQTRLWFLSDIFPIPPIGVAFSIGDVFVAIGLFLLIQQLLSHRRSAGTLSS